MTLLYTQRLDCRLCGQSDFDPIIDLGDLALTGRFPRSDEAAVPSAPLRVHKCRNCHLVQLEHDFDRDALFRESYGYRSGINQTMTNHLAGIVNAICERVPLGAGDLILDIGSNDATLLKQYDVAGLKRIGMDPTIAQYAHFYPEDVMRVPDFFAAAAFDEATGGQRAKAISSIAMLYDLPDLHAFTADIAHCLADDGVWGVRAKLSAEYVGYHGLRYDLPRASALPQHSNLGSTADRAQSANLPRRT